MLRARADIRSPETQRAIELMAGFAERTGLTSSQPPRRYLWTDAFAVCNFLALWHATEDGYYRDCAFQLIDQVHGTLGKFRPDSPREGWISGLNEVEGQRHPTRGGLRIGKDLPERAIDEPPDVELEWERDGQYFHYLTRWMHALDQTARFTRKVQYNLWARELAQLAYGAFRYELPETGQVRMAWKMSTDLTRPLVRSMGQHDPIDGYITCAQLRATASALGAEDDPGLQEAQRGFEAMTKTGGWATPDPLGIGGLLLDAFRADQLSGKDTQLPRELVPALLRAALSGLRVYVTRADFSQQGVSRLGFRELGLAIGLRVIETMELTKEADVFRDPNVRLFMEQLRSYITLRSQIESACLESEHRQEQAWMEHRDINEVMLATSLVPDGVMSLSYSSR